MDHTPRSAMRSHLARIAPGTQLRDGLDRIVHGRTGALIVLGNNDALDRITTGGFTIDVDLTATALRELAKMDGAILLNDDLTRILHAGVHLMPDASVPTDEAGTRHRTADRAARLTGLPVVTVSASMSTIALFYQGHRHLVQRPEHLLARANQALATLARYRDRLGQAAARLSALEIQDAVTISDVAHLAQRLEMVRRLVAEIDDSVIELGVDGRLVRLQQQELSAGLDQLVAALEHDYAHGGRPLSMASLSDASTDELLDPAAIASGIGFPATASLESRVHARGYRHLAQVGRVPAETAHRLVEHFGTLQALFGASTVDLVSVEGVDYALARRIREGLARLTENTYHDRGDLPSM